MVEKSVYNDTMSSRSYICIFSRLCYFILAVFIGLFLLNSTNVYAQGSGFGISTRVPIEGTTLLDGYIVATDENGYVTTTRTHQSNIVGVISENPAIQIISEEENPNTYPLTTSGEAYVWVTLANGPIEQGDIITSSPWEGIGMKSTSAGSYLGTALEDVQVDNDVNTDQIITKVRVAIAPGETLQPNAVNIKTERETQPFSPASLTRFVVGSIIVLITIFMSLTYFGRLSRSGVEALGRNPIAYKKIQFGITISVIIGFLVAIVGIIAALYIMN